MGLPVGEPSVQEDIRMKLYDWPNSYNSKKIRAVAFETDTRLELVPVDMTKGEHKTPQFLAKNPNGKVPVLEDGSFTVWESNAIICYLAAQDPSRRLLPQDPKKRSQVDRWMFWQTAHLSPSVGKISYERLWKARMGQGASDESVVAQAMPEVERYLGVLDSWLGQKQWVADELSVADFALGSVLSIRHDIQLDISKYKNVLAWLERLENRSSWKAALSPV
jgi:glutathione S-transferase